MTKRGWNLPCGHVVQVFEYAVVQERLNQVPRGQGVMLCVVQMLSLVPQQLPSAWYFPVGQYLHWLDDVRAGTSLYLPAGQPRHWLAVVRLVYWL